MSEVFLKDNLGKIKNGSNLMRTAQRCGTLAPLKLHWDIIKDRLKICAEKHEYFSKHEHEYQ